MMNSKNKKIVAFMVVTVFVLCTISVALAASNRPIPYINNPQDFKRPPMGGISDGDITCYANGIKLFRTTMKDYDLNREYFDRKFGIGKHWRENRALQEFRDISYKPHKSAIENGYPIIYIDANKN